MAIKSYANKAAYNAAVKPTIESQVSMIETTREIIVDGVNVITTSPVVGDLVFLNESNEITFVKGGSWIQKAIIPSAWTHVGYVYTRKGKQVGVIDKNGADRKYADVVQFKLNDPTLDGAEHTASIGVRVTGGTSAGYGSNTTISYTYTATTLADVVTALNAAIDAAKTSLGFTNTLWAYLADADGNKVDDAANATQIIVQLDTWDDYRQYTCAGMTHITWGDMPASDVYWRGERGFSTNYWGVMNIARTKAWATSSGRVPSSNEPVGPRAGNDTPVKPSEFSSSQYCAGLRAAYKTYEEYLEKCYMVVFPQKYGSFALPGGKELTMKYALMSAPTKAGGTKYKFPALYYGYNRTYGVDGLDFGDWYLPGVYEGTQLMKDECINTLAPSITKMGTAAINNSTSRWFAERYGVYGARNFSGYDGVLNGNSVVSTLRCQAVALLEID